MDAKVLNKICRFIEGLNQEQIFDISEAEARDINYNYVPYMFFDISLFKEEKVENHLVYLVGEKNEEFNNLFSEIVDYYEKKKKLYSKNFIEKVLKIGIEKYLNSKLGLKEDNFQDYIRRELEKSSTHFKVLIQIEGLSINGYKFVFGKCEFRKFNINSMNHYISKNHNVILDKSDFVSGIPDGIWACIVVDAIDSYTAKELAQQYLNKIMGNINFFSFIFFRSQSQKSIVSLPGLQREFNITTISYSVKREGEFRYFVSFDKVHAIAINKISKSKKLGKIFNKYRFLLRDSKNNSFSDSLSNSINFAGKSMTMSNRETKVIYLIMSLESLLLPSHDTTNLSFRLSLIICKLLSKNHEKRKQIFSKMQTLYKIRSKIVHGGIIDVTDSEVNELTYYVSAVLINILDSKYFQLSDIKNMETLNKELSRIIIEK